MASLRLDNPSDGLWRSNDTFPPDETIAPYIYEPFKSADSEIRLLELEPSSNFAAPVRIQLKKVSFNKNVPYCRYYQALSYEWGSTNNPATIQVYNADNMACGTIKVTRNCEEALRYLRLRAITRTLWVDAICINQRTDAAALTERSIQVSIMAQIFKRAARVNAWIGPADQDSQVAFDYIKLVGKHFHYNFETTGLETLSDDPEWSWTPVGWRPAGEGVEANVDNRQLAAVMTVLSRSYFQRLWIWPEVLLGGKHSHLVCGRHLSPWSDFLATVSYLWSAASMDAAYREFPSMDRSNFWLKMMTVYGCLQLHKFSLLGRLNFMRDCACSDDKDRIYVAQSLRRVDDTDILVPDYSSSASVGDVWTDAIITYIHGRRDLKFLRYSQRSHTKIHGLPSWVPDWSQPQQNLLYEHRQTPWLTGVSLLSVDRQVLRVQGCFVATVQAVTPFEFTFQNVDVTALFTAFRGMAVAHGRSDAHQLAALFHSVARIFGKRTSFTDYQLCMAAVLSELEQQLAWDWRDYFHLGLILGYVCNLMLGRALISSDHYPIGLGPGNAQPGDVVAALSGYAEVMTLRPVAGGYYKVIGDAYFETLLAGEALLGPLPSSLAVTLVKIPGWKASMCGFVDTTTCSIIYDDPRLPALAADWVRKYDREGDESTLYFENTLTGEQRDRIYDPRCDEDELIKRGVKLQEFALV